MEGHIRYRSKTLCMPLYCEDSLDALLQYSHIVDSMGDMTNPSEFCNKRRIAINVIHKLHTCTSIIYPGILCMKIEITFMSLQYSDI